MGKFIYTFKRYEKKYLIDEKQYTALLERIRYKMLPDSYGTTTICNLYYDTPDKLLIRRSLDKPLYKEKLRLRCYDVPKDNSMDFIEIKKKFRGIVYKRRLAVTYKQARDYLPNGYLDVENQIKKEIDWFCRSYENLTPAVAWADTALHRNVMTKVSKLLIFIKLFDFMGYLGYNKNI